MPELSGYDQPLRHLLTDTIISLARLSLRPSDRPQGLSSLLPDSLSLKPGSWTLSSVQIFSEGSYFIAFRGRHYPD